MAETYSFTTYSSQLEPLGLSPMLVISNTSDGGVLELTSLDMELQISNTANSSGVYTSFYVDFVGGLIDGYSGGWQNTPNGNRSSSSISANVKVFSGANVPRPTSILWRRPLWHFDGAGRDLSTNPIYKEQFQAKGSVQDIQVAEGEIFAIMQGSDGLLDRTTPPGTNTAIEPAEGFVDITFTFNSNTFVVSCELTPRYNTGIVISNESGSGFPVNINRIAFRTISQKERHATNEDGSSITSLDPICPTMNAEIVELDKFSGGIQITPSKNRTGNTDPSTICQIRTSTALNEINETPREGVDVKTGIQAAKGSALTITIPNRYFNLPSRSTVGRVMNWYQPNSFLAGRMNPLTPIVSIIHSKTGYAPKLEAGQSLVVWGQKLGYARASRVFKGTFTYTPEAAPPSGGNTYSRSMVVNI